jgi:hypothetical protein
VQLSKSPRPHTFQDMTAKQRTRLFIRVRISIERANDGFEVKAHMSGIAVGPQPAT